MTSRQPSAAVLADEWTANRAPEVLVGASATIRRRRRAGYVGQLTGVGYTPRIVALAGLMLRGLQQGSGMRGGFDPPIGFAAGATLAAAVTAREWLSCITLGWYWGGLYWSALGVRPPPDSRGLPITIRGVQL